MPPSLGHPFPPGASRVISYMLARQVAPWIALPSPHAEPSIGLPGKVWASRSYVEASRGLTRSPELLVALYYQAAGVQLWNTLPPP